LTEPAHADVGRLTARGREPAADLETRTAGAHDGAVIRPDEEGGSPIKPHERGEQMKTEISSRPEGYTTLRLIAENVAERKQLYRLHQRALTVTWKEGSPRSLEVESVELLLSPRDRFSDYW
jgi:hypothetical protein